MANRPPDPPFQARQFQSGIRNAQEYGALDLTGKRDCWYWLQQALDDMAANEDFELEIPAGDLRISQPLVARTPTPRIRGFGYRTRILADTTEFTALTVGTGAIGGVPSPAGWVQNLRIRCPRHVNSPVGNTAGLRIDGALFTEVRNVSSHFFPIGFDITNNGYGSSFYNCRTFSAECRIALLLRGEVGGLSIGAGNDISFYNCWFHGGDTAIFIEGNQGTYNFYGGQLSGGLLSGLGISDDRGALVTSGKSFQTGLPLGGCGLHFYDMAFERVHRGWGFRHFGLGQDPGGVVYLCQGCRWFAGTGAIGLIKITGGYNDRVNLDFNAVAPDTWSSAEPIVYSGAGGASRPFCAERGTYGKPTFNGVLRDLNDRSLLFHSPTVPYIRSQNWAFDFNTGRNVFWTVAGVVSTDERGQVVFTDRFTIAP